VCTHTHHYVCMKVCIHTCTHSSVCYLVFKEELMFRFPMCYSCSNCLHFFFEILISLFGYATITLKNEQFLYPYKPIDFSKFENPQIYLCQCEYHTYTNFVNVSTIPIQTISNSNKKIFELLSIFL
jgi:hypothetical protein